MITDEALATTNLNLLLDVGFNREVGHEGALYFNKEHGNLSSLIDNELENEEIKKLSLKAKNRILEEYSWQKIVNAYETLFINDANELEYINSNNSQLIINV